MPQEWLRPKNIASIFRLSRSTVNKLLNEGKIPGAEKSGNTRWQINKQEFDEWVKENTVKVPKFSKLAYDDIQHLSEEFWELAPDWLTPEEVFDEFTWVDAEVPRQTFYENLGSGRIPGAIKIGGSWRIHKSTLRSWKGEYSLGESISIADAESGRENES